MMSKDASISETTHAVLPPEFGSQLLAETHHSFRIRGGERTESVQFQNSRLGLLNDAALTAPTCPLDIGPKRMLPVSSGAYVFQQDFGIRLDVFSDVASVNGNDDPAVEAEHFRR